MRRFMILLCLLVLYVNMTHTDPHRYPDLRYDSIITKPVTYSNLIISEIVNLSLVDATLVFVCFILTIIVYQRHLWNKRLRKRIKELKYCCQKDITSVGKLQPFLEDCRSKNSGLEMPLRKLARQCDVMVSGIKKQQTDINSLYDEFQDYKRTWQTEAAHTMAVQENDLLANIEALKIRTEFAMLKDYVGRELKSVKFVAEYNKAMIDEAVDDVDRIMVSEVQLELNDLENRKLNDVEWLIENENPKEPKPLSQNQIRIEL